MRISTIICAIVLLTHYGTAHAVPSGVGGLVWSDEFSGNELDLTKWFHRASGPRGDPADHFYLTPEAVSVANGLLTIKTYTEGGNHYSGMIGNYLYNPAFGVGAVNGMNHAYGYFEARARFHTTSGVGSAFWLQSATIGNPINNPQAAGVEMDIFEHRVHNPLDYYLYPGLTPTTDITNRINEALIWNGYGPEQQLTKKLSNTLPGLANDTWHTFGLKWTPTGYTFYYDGVSIWTGGGAPVSQAPEYVILSSEVLQSFAGAIPEGGYGARGDFNSDGNIDAADYVAWRALKGKTIPRASGADANANGVVGPEDYNVWETNFGGSLSVTNVKFDYVRVYALAAGSGGFNTDNIVPEPRALVLLVIALVSLPIRLRAIRAAAS